MNEQQLELSLKEITCIAPGINAIPIVLASIQGAIESAQNYSKMSKQAGFDVMVEASDEAVAFLNSWIKALESVRAEHIHEYNILRQAQQTAQAAGGLGMNIFQDRSTDSSADIDET